MPVREKALRQWQHAKIARGIYEQGRCLADNRFQRPRDGWKTQQTALLLDPEGKAGRAYGAKNTPNMVVINPEGKVVYEGAIDSKATPNPADIPNSTNYVKVALDESLAGKPVTTSTTKPYGCSVKYK